MRKLIAQAVHLFIIIFSLSACGGGTPAIPRPVHTSPAPILTPTPTPVTLTERLSHVDMADPSLLADYLYRSFIQIPVGVVWGPDEHLYIADWTGQHVVRMAKDYSYDDLLFWQSVSPLQEDGPRHIAFDSQSNLYVANHSRIYRVTPDGTVTELQGLMGSPTGSIIVGPGDVLYYTDRGDPGALYRVNSDGSSELLINNILHSENMAFAPDGSLYMTQLGVAQILKIDLTTRVVTTFATDICTFDPCYLAVDSEGDLWVRGIFYLTRFDPDGSIKPYVLDGETYPGGPLNWHTAGGIAFDDVGSLWITSYNSWIYRMIPVNPGTPDPEFSLQLAYPGLEASDLEVHPDGSVYGTDMNTHQLLRFSGGSEPASVYSHPAIGRSAVAIDQNGTIYLSLTTGEIVVINQDGTASHYASVNTRRMVIGGDGNLYAIAGAYGESKTLVRVTGVDEITVLADQIDSIPLGNGESHLALALNNGLYLFMENSRQLFKVDFNGQGYLLADLSVLGQGGPVVFAASPTTGEIFYLPCGPYEVFRISPDGEYTGMLAGSIYGDPWGIDVSADGEWLYVAESGVIDHIPIP